MGKLTDVLSLPEPERTNTLVAMDETEVFELISPENFKVKYQGKVKKIKKGKNTVPLKFAVWLLNKYDGTTPGFPVLKEAEKPEESKDEAKP